MKKAFCYRRKLYTQRNSHRKFDSSKQCPAAPTAAVAVTAATAAAAAAQDKAHKKLIKIACVCVFVSVCLLVCLCVCFFVHVPCKRKPYMTQLSEPKRLCNYESFYASVCTCASVCVCVCIGAGICNEAKRLPLWRSCYCMCVVVASAAAGHADCRQPRERHQLRASWSTVC